MFWKNVVKCYGNVVVTFVENVLKCFSHTDNHSIMSITDHTDN